MGVKTFRTTACQMFTSYGIMAVSLGDISARSGVKIKALKKNELVEECVLMLEYQLMRKLEPVFSDFHQPVLKRLLAVYDTWFCFAMGINQAFYYDLKRHYPEQFDQLTKMADRISQNVAANLIVLAKTQRKLPQHLDEASEVGIHRQVLEKLWERVESHRSFSLAEILQRFLQMRFTHLSSLILHQD